MLRNPYQWAVVLAISTICVVRASLGSDARSNSQMKEVMNLCHHALIIQTLQLLAKGSQGNSETQSGLRGNVVDPALADRRPKEAAVPERGEGCRS